jgi:hypothetical protein
MPPDNVIQLSVPGAPPAQDDSEPASSTGEGGAVVEVIKPATNAPAPKFSVPGWVWLAGGAVLFLGLVYFLQRNHLLKTPKRRANPAPRPKARRKPKPKQEYIPADEVEDED